ncbi:PEPxxWA-CTERM sorting domain-containing protein [Sphingomonas aliaeris]|uniref:PEPxxWA-CTERM sorting domain-containing protein n=2 Tax=Sphingomonas aliaeris TaxID=2759526 RepID=A0A974NY41_9SPHN|nr:PEPxxWA-CTERM sorting domain-containing protein [Sphingomonas aliaeris]
MTNAYTSALCAAAVLTAVAAAPATAQNFTNPGTIDIIDDAETTSDINVTGVTGNVTGLTLSLNGLTHTYPDDLVFGVYNASQDLGFVFFSGVGGRADISNVTLSFSDFAAFPAPRSFVGNTELVSGTYLPSNYLDFSFTSAGNATSFSDFLSGDVNGLWTLIAIDTVPADTGSIANGWSLNFTTSAAPAVPEPATWGMMILGFGMIGAAARRRKVKTSVRFA